MYVYMYPISIILVIKREINSAF